MSALGSKSSSQFTAFKMKFRGFFFLSTCCSVLKAVVSDTTTDHDITHADALVSWIRAERGFVNAKLEIGRSDLDNSESIIGLFATEDIGAGDKLLEVSSDIIISFSPDYEGEGALNCNGVRALAEQLRLGNESQYSPFINYLLDTRPSTNLPSAWSEAGKELLLEVLGEDEDEEQILPPFDPIGWVSVDWHEDCDGLDESLENYSAVFVAHNSYQNALVPLFDMIGHRNGHWLNSETNFNPASPDFDIQLTATRDIKAGEEIYVSDNLCKDCGDRATTYGTAELFRDNGIVEQYPQRWIIENENREVRSVFEIDETYDDDSLATGEYDIKWISEYSEDDIEFMEEQLERLLEFDTLFESNSPIRSIPTNEWSLLVDFYQDMMSALAFAVGAADTECLNEGTCDVSGRYVDLDEEPEGQDLNGYQGMSCEMKGFFPWNDIWNEFEDEKSHYQNIIFFEDPETHDTCLELDSIVQICESYRPHYHEMAVHYPARFLENIKRVVFVGGGDSMLLHETLKYPSLELVVGLELDQKVVRRSFKYFGTQPHYDDEKVQWWYGDASKSLMMLPKDYFGSFDMVLVDLSETVMSFKVTNGLDIMEALTLLLKKDGIFVKNEFYVDKMKSMFDYTAQIHHYSQPITCAQGYALGSNGIDFMSPDLRDHDVDNFFLQPLELITDPFTLYHDYHHNKSSAQLCIGGQYDLGLGSDLSEQSSSPGILMIVEAEDADATLLPLDILERNIIRVLEKQGFSVVSTVISKFDSNGMTVVVILQEGYIMARTYSKYNYCAFDIHLWSSFEKHEEIKKALLAVVGSGSKSSSSFRIIAGGMFGVKTWKEDEKKKGPRFIEVCDDHDEILPYDVSVEQSTIDVVLKEMLNLLDENNMSISVLCGENREACKSINTFDEHDDVADVLGLSCSGIESINEYAEDTSVQLLACEKHISSMLYNTVSEGEKLSVIMVDSSANSLIAEIVLKIFSRKKAKKELLMTNVLVMSPKLGSAANWRRNFSKKFLEDVFVSEPTYYTEVLFSSSDTSLEFDFTSFGDEKFFQKLTGVLQSIEVQSGLVSDVQSVVGGEWLYNRNFKPSHSFGADDYDQSSPLEQWKSQKALGHQSIFQLESEEKHNISIPQIQEALSATLLKMSLSLKGSDEGVEQKEFNGIGNGCIFLVLWSGGSAIIMWDGNFHIDINLFMYEENEEKTILFKDSFVEKMTISLHTVLHDQHPRGIGRVVNFLNDAEPNTNPRWV